MQFLMNVFGKSLKSGASNEILQWMAPGVHLSELFSDSLVSVDADLYVDRRLRAPIVCEVGAAGIPMTSAQNRSILFPPRVARSVCVTEIRSND